MITYILIGVLFMFLLEHFTKLERFKKHVELYPDAYVSFGFLERIMGIIFWPLFLAVFLYNFLKQIFK